MDLRMFVVFWCNRKKKGDGSKVIGALPGEPNGDAKLSLY
jgi:hypothetical protein